MTHEGEDRRQYKRVHAPVFCRPIGTSLRFVSERAQATDISRGGLRIYADEAPKQGAQLEIELFLPGNASVTCRVEVVWIEAIAGGNPARYDVGLRFVDISDADRARLGAVLGDA